VTWNVVSALAAVGALCFAWETVRETRALRREDRLGRLPELVAELGILAMTSGNVTPHYTIPRRRVAAMLAPLDDPLLPNCRLLASGPEFDDPIDLATAAGAKRVEDVTHAALDELAALMRPETTPTRDA
jgi:hypothetical protein